MIINQSFFDMLVTPMDIFAICFSKVNALLPFLKTTVKYREI